MVQGEHSCEHFQGRVESMYGAWAVVQAVGDVIKSVLSEQAQVRALGQILLTGGRNRYDHQLGVLPLVGAEHHAQVWHARQERVQQGSLRNVPEFPRCRRPSKSRTAILRGARCMPGVAAAWMLQSRRPALPSRSRPTVGGYGVLVWLSAGICCPPTPSERWRQYESTSVLLSATILTPPR